jgi:hypothetical protein
MELYNKIISIVDSNLIYCLVPMILALILIRLIFKDRFPTKKALNLIRWIIIGYTIITLMYFIIGMLFYSEDYAFTNRATGPYKYAYWLMLISATVLPFTLLIKKLSTKFWYVLLIAFFMKVGVYFERFVIITTSFHRDYAPNVGMTNITESLIYGLSVFFIQGFIISVILIGILKMIERKKLRTTTYIKHS